MDHSLLIILDELHHVLTCAVFIVCLIKLHKGHNRILLDLNTLVDLGMVVYVCASNHRDTTDCITLRIVDEYLAVCVLVLKSSEYLFQATSNQYLLAIQWTEDRLKAGWKGLLSCVADHLPALVYLCKVQSLDSNHCLNASLIEATDDIYAGAMDTATVPTSRHVQGRHLRPGPLTFQIKPEAAAYCSIKLYLPTYQIDMHIFVAAKTCFTSREAPGSWIFCQGERTAIL